MAYNPNNPFRNSTNARYLEALFFERVGADKTTVLYTLKDEDHLSFPSLYRLYMECNDPSEYMFATSHLDGWEHWEMLCKCSWFKPYIERWRRELGEKIRAIGIQEIIKDAQDTGSKTRIQSSRYLAEKGWLKDEPFATGATKGKGRPKSEDLKRQAVEEHIQTTTLVNNDFERLLGRKLS